ncbi:MAG: tRNA dihydrouridine synthase DusB [Proteobacteria bacterium]|nr:tRNA dihydrouridine synthase DusB [Pseudomonadota bacterium]
MRIGPFKLAMPVLLAPMSGVTDRPFRCLVKRLGAGLVVSEMIASQAMIRRTRQTMKMIEKASEECPAVVQLAGNEPEVMAEAAKLNEDLGAQIIDINFGCPMKKIVNNYAGSFLMKDEILASKILEAVVKAVKLPVTLKMRTGWDEHNRNAPKIAKIAEECGIQMLTVHGRTRCQLYTGRADWAFIRQVKGEVEIPVVGNGDIVNEEDAKVLLEKSQADGVMIGRGTYGRPWFINQVGHFLKTGDYLPAPSIQQQHEIVLQHLEDILYHYGEKQGVRIARKHISWYSKGLDGSADYRVRVNQCDDIVSMKELINDFYLPIYQ